MFKIIGADQKEYGPVTTEQIRQWIVEGRLNAQTRAQREGGGEWQPLSAFEEFADVLRPAAPSPAAPSPMAAPAPMTASAAPTGSRDAALNAVKGPAIALIVSASLGVGYYLFNTFFILVGHAPVMLNQNASPQMRAFLQGMHGPMAVFFSLAIVAMNAFVLLGAVKMMKLQNHTLAFVACIIAMVPCTGCACILGLPFGIWGLVMLNKAEVKSQFES